jgi:hypothetical protein
MTNEQIIEMARRAGAVFPADGSYHSFEKVDDLKAFAKLVAQHEREEIAQIFDADSHLVDFARNDKGGCLICGFTPKVAAQLIRARGEA